MEQMLTSGDDLNKVREMRFRESLETSYQSPGKRRKLHDRQEAVQPMPRSRASPATRSRQTWPARAGLPSLTSKPPPTANLCRKSPGAPLPKLSPPSSLIGWRQLGTCPALPSTLSSGSSRDSTPGNLDESQHSRVHHLRLHHQGLLLHQHEPHGRAVRTGAATSSSPPSTLQKKTTFQPKSIE